MIRTGILPEERISAFYWTGAEEQLLRRHYPAGGTRACLPHLPRRSGRAIAMRAHQLGLSRKVAA